jgi:hypothetical protein
MAGNLCERRLHGWIHRRRRRLPRHNRSSAVVCRLHIHEAPRCCDQATLQWKSVRDCGAIQKNAKRCKNRTKFRKLTAQVRRPTATDLGRRTCRDLSSANELNPQAMPAGCLLRNIKQPAPSILSPSSPSFVSWRGSNRIGVDQAAPGSARCPLDAIQVEPGTPVTIEVWNGPSGPPTPRPPRNKGRSPPRPLPWQLGPISPRRSLAVGPSASTPGTPRENFCGFIDP